MHYGEEFDVWNLLDQQKDVESVCLRDCTRIAKERPISVLHLIVVNTLHTLA